MRSCCKTQGAQPGTLWQPRRVGWGKWKGSSRGRGYMYTYSWFMLLYGRNQHNIVKQFSFNLKILKKDSLLIGYWWILKRGFDWSIWILMGGFCQYQLDSLPIRRVVADSIATNRSVSPETAPGLWGKAKQRRWTVNPLCWLFCYCEFLEFFPLSGERNSSVVFSTMSWPNQWRWKNWGEGVVGISGGLSKKKQVQRHVEVHQGPPPFGPL